MRFLAALTLLFFAAGCAHKPVPAAQTVVLDYPKLTGKTWIQECTVIDDKVSIREELRFHKSEIGPLYSVATNWYADKKCNGLMRIDYSLRKVRDVKDSSAGLTINGTLISVLRAATDKRVVKQYNEKSNCGISTWTKNQMYDVTNSPCTVVKDEAVTLGVSDDSLSWTIFENGQPKTATLHAESQEQLNSISESVESAILFSPALIDKLWLDPKCSVMNNGESVSEAISFTKNGDTLRYRVDTRFFSDKDCKNLVRIDHATRRVTYLKPWVAGWRMISVLEKVTRTSPGENKKDLDVTKSSINVSPKEWVTLAVSPDSLAWTIYFDSGSLTGNFKPGTLEELAAFNSLK